MSLLLDALNRASKDKAAAAMVPKAIEPATPRAEAAPESESESLSWPTVEPVWQSSAVEEPVTHDTSMQLVIEPEPPTLAVMSEPTAQPVLKASDADTTRSAASSAPVTTGGPQVAQAILRAKEPGATTTAPTRLIVLGAVAVTIAIALGSVMLGAWGDPMAWFQSASPLRPAGQIAVIARPIEPAATSLGTAMAVTEPASAPGHSAGPVVADTPAAKPRVKPRPTIAAADRKPASPDAAARTSADNTLKSALRAVASGNSAATLLQPSAAPSALETGYAALTQGRLQEAQRAYNLALAGNPQERDALLGLAYIADRTGRVEEAQSYYRRVLRQEPGNPVAQAGLLNLSTDEDALTLSSRSRELAEQHPDSATAQSVLGQSLARQGRLADARLAFTRALQLEPGVALHAFNLAVALDRLHSYAQAVEYYERAIALSAQSGGESASGVPNGVVQQRLAQLRGVGADLPATLH